MSQPEAPPLAAAPSRQGILRWWPMALLALLLLAVLELMVWPHPLEPTYRGKSLSQWFNEIKITGGGIMHSDPAIDALVSMGEPAVPFLARQFMLQPSRLEDYLSAGVQKLPWPKWRWTTRRERIFKAYVTLMLMGPRARAAIPQLIHVAENKQSQYQHFAVRLLGYIHGEPAQVVPVLIRLLPERGDVGAQAAVSLASFGREAAGAVPQLRERLQAPDGEQSRAAVAVALLAMEESLDLALPAARDSLASTNHYTRRLFVESFDRLDAGAKAAVPILVEALQNTDQSVREQAARVLKKIDPAAAAKAGVK